MVQVSAQSSGRRGPALVGKTSPVTFLRQGSSKRTANGELLTCSWRTTGLEKSSLPLYMPMVTRKPPSTCSSRILRSRSFSLATLSRSRRLASRSWRVSRRCSGSAVCCDAWGLGGLNPVRRLKSDLLVRFLVLVEAFGCCGLPTLAPWLVSGRPEEPGGSVCLELLFPILMKGIASAGMGGSVSFDGYSPTTRREM